MLFDEEASTVLKLRMIILIPFRLEPTVSGTTIALTIGQTRRRELFVRCWDFPITVTGSWEKRRWGHISTPRLTSPPQSVALKSNSIVDLYNLNTVSIEKRDSEKGLKQSKIEIETIGNV